MNFNLNLYKLNFFINDFFFLILKEFNCCGFNTPDDWYDRGHQTPTSCCKSMDIRCPSEQILGTTFSCLFARTLKKTYENFND